MGISAPSRDGPYFSRAAGGGAVLGTRMCTYRCAQHREKRQQAS